MIALFLALSALASPAAANPPASLPTARPTPAASRADQDAEALFRRRVTPLVQVARDASPSVVFIRNDGVQTAQDWFGRVFPQKFEGTGSGVVIHKAGFIITNYHVVNGAQKLSVSFDKQYDTTVYQAEIVWSVPEDDLALLKIRGERDFPAIPLGTSSDLMLGETVIAIGNPMGETHTVSQGIVSGLHRNANIQTQFGLLKFDDLIQTDASINPGNSGGPLLNINGELIGINNAMNPNAQNIGFAIPVDHVKMVLEERKLAPDSAPTWLGFEVDGTDHVQIANIVPGSPADAAGLRPGDCIVALGGVTVGTQDEYHMARLGLSPSREFDVRVERAGQARTVRLAPWDKYEGVLYAKLGLKVKTVESRYSYVKVTEVRAGGPAAELGLKPGDAIDAVRPLVGDRPRPWRIISRERFADLLSEFDAGTRLELDVYRDVDGDNAYEPGELHRGTLMIR